MLYTAKNHIFALCAYKESPYLEACITSLRQQSIPSRIILCTATPNESISALAEKYEIPLLINRGPQGIAEDWSFAYAQAHVPLVTLAHQDDVYDFDYLKKIIEAVNRAAKPLIAFTDYYELRNDRKFFAKENRNLRIKEIGLLPLRPHVCQASRWIRRRVLSLCNPICCPAVTFVKDNLPEAFFESHFQSDLDWQAWERLSRLKGSFCYVHEPLMGHRIHEGSTTTKVIGDNNGRSTEDLEMYLKFWPRPIAVLLNRFYTAGQDQNKL